MSIEDGMSVISTLRNAIRNQRNYDDTRGASTVRNMGRRESLVICFLDQDHSDVSTKLMAERRQSPVANGPEGPIKEKTPRIIGSP